MILQKLQLDEEFILEFALDVFGTSASPSIVEFVIQGDDFGIKCNTIIEENTVKVKIPKMKGILKEGVYQSSLNVIVDGKIFTPLNESVEFEPLIEFGVIKQKAESVKSGVSVSLKNVKSPVFEDTNHVPNNFLLAEQDGFEVVKMKNFDVLRKNGKLYGFVSEKAYLKTENGYDTLPKLLEYMA